MTESVARRVNRKVELVSVADEEDIPLDVALEGMPPVPLEPTFYDTASATMSAALAGTKILLNGTAYAATCARDQFLAIDWPKVAEKMEYSRDAVCSVIPTRALEKIPMMVNRMIEDPSSFKTRNSYEKRCVISAQFFQEHPDRIPIIVEKSSYECSLPELSKNKFITPLHMPVGTFLYLIRSQLKIDSAQSIFLCRGGIPLLNVSETMESVYQRYRDSDGFLYLQYRTENVFG